MNFCKVFSVLIFQLLPMLLLSQSSPAAQNYFQGNYKTCIQLSEEMLHEDSKNASAHFLKGASLIKLKDYKNGQASLDMAKKYEFPNVVALQGNSLLAFAGLQQTEKLLINLEDYASQGFSNLNIFQEEEFKYLKKNKAFNTLKEKVEANAFPCRFSEKSQRLDFWLGEWDVYTNGAKSANSIITKSPDNCSLLEDYRTLNGYTGVSLSYYDAVDSLYHQTWVDRSNAVIHFTETKSKKGYLQMITTNGLTRMSYTYNSNNDIVTQTMESTPDNGKTWNNTFTGIYKRKKTISK